MSSRITFQESLIIWICSSLGCSTAASSLLLSAKSVFAARPDIAQPILGVTLTKKGDYSREKNNSLGEKMSLLVSPDSSAHL